MEGNPDQHSLKLSVCTIAGRTAADCRTVIEELRRQSARAEMELIVVTPDRAGISDEALAEFGGYQWVILPEIRTCGEAVEAAVRVARAPFVAYAEEHSFFDEAWAERLIAAHGRGYDVVGFAMENANPQTLTSWAHLYGQFGPVVAPVESGESAVLGGHHVSYRKELLLGYGSRVGELLEDETVLFLDLRAKGKPLSIAGDAISRHVNISRLTAYMAHDYRGQRSFAGTRAGAWPWWKRGAYVVAAPLIPFVRLRRILADIRRSGRQKELLPQILVPIFLALLAGAWGEMLGYLLGGGACAESRVPVELQRAQFLSKKEGASLPASPRS